MMRVIQLPIIVPHVVVAIFVVNIFSQNGVLARIGYALGMLQEQQQFPMLIYDTKGVESSWHICGRRFLYNLFCYCSDGNIMRTGEAA